MTIQRQTKQLEAIRQAFQVAKRPLSIDEIHQIGQTLVPSLGLRTVYRCVSRLEAEGEVARVAIPGNRDRYELASVADVHHHHFHCSKCDRYFDVFGCPGGLSKIVPPGFNLQSHELTLIGLCDSCCQ